MNVKQQGFHVRIEQHKKLIEPVNGLVTLDKSEFIIVFEFSEPMGLLLNGSFKKKTYKFASKGKSKSQLLGFQKTGMAEGLLNPVYLLHKQQYNRLGFLFYLLFPFSILTPNFYSLHSVP